ncbi:hypothetical protein [Candidatus Flexifilum breve]
MCSETGEHRQTHEEFNERLQFPRHRACSKTHRGGLPPRLQPVV